MANLQHSTEPTYKVHEHHLVASKVCTSCKEEKDIEQFKKRYYANGVISYRARCKKCMAHVRGLKRNKKYVRDHFEGEIWADVPFEGYNYEVSTFGRIRRKDNGREIKPGKHTYNYRSITLYNNNNKITTFVHRIVALTFIPNPENKKYINHLDANKTNNRIENLEWCTAG